MTFKIQRWTRLGIAVLAMTLSACIPDRPPLVAGKLSPALQRTLGEMNTIGTQDNREQLYTYTLADNCDLHATKFLNGHPIKHMILSLKDTQFGRYDYAPSLGYAVRTMNQDGGIDNVVFDAPALESIQSMLELLEKAKAECLGASAPSDHAKVSNPG